MEQTSVQAEQIFYFFSYGHHLNLVSASWLPLKDSCHSKGAFPRTNVHRLRFVAIAHSSEPLGSRRRFKPFRCHFVCNYPQMCELSNYLRVFIAGIRSTHEWIGCNRRISAAEHPRTPLSNLEQLCSGLRAARVSPARRLIIKREAFASVTPPHQHRGSC